MATILCVDDEPSVGTVLEHALKRLGHEPILATSVNDAMQTLEERPIDLVLADYLMPGATGLDLLDLLEQSGLRVPVIIMTGYSSIEHAVESIKKGAIDYLTKPVQIETLEIAIQQTLEVIQLRKQNEVYRQEIRRHRTRRAIVGESETMRRLLETIATVAPTRATVLLEGESGTGKELFARAIHELSPRQDAAFITINCAALPDGLVESVLFGHEKGAFTGAGSRSSGAFERADGGTLLLDEISEMRLDLQAKLLRVIQEQEFERVGGHRAIRVDARLIATTNRDLQAEVEAGRFRDDLFYRLNVIPIHTPAVRERVPDIPALVLHFARRAAEQLGVAVPGIPPETLDLLQAYDWPGNVRELGNSVERAVILSRGGPLTPSLFHLSGTGPPRRVTGGTANREDGDGENLPLNLAEMQRVMIERALRETGGNRTRAARLLGISERTLRNRLNKP